MNCEWFFTFISMECTALYLALFTIIEENTFFAFKRYITSRNNAILNIIITQIYVSEATLKIKLAALYSKTCLWFRCACTNNKRPTLPALTLTSPPYISIEPFAYKPSFQPPSATSLVSILRVASITFME